jgi:hypothetical protein
MAFVEKSNTGSVGTGSIIPNRIETKGTIIPKVKSEKRAYNTLQAKALTIYNRYGLTYHITRKKFLFMLYFLLQAT